MPPQLNPKLPTSSPTTQFRLLRPPPDKPQLQKKKHLRGQRNQRAPTQSSKKILLTSAARPPSRWVTMGAKPVGAPKTAYQDSARCVSLDDMHTTALLDVGARSVLPTYCDATNTFSGPIVSKDPSGGRTASACSNLFPPRCEAHGYLNTKNSIQNPR